MPASLKSELRKPVTPYICSTPLDFNEERQFLSDEVFPKISELCRSRGSYFSPVDLRWKPIDAMTHTGLLLKTLLDATKMCSPFFLCLLGETYGPYRSENEARLVLPKNEQQLQIPVDCHWLDTNLLLAGSGGHPWVLKEGHQYSSITELEVTQGALLSDSPYVTLYYRRSDHLDNKHLARSENEKSNKPDLNVYYSESQQAKVKIHNLRQRLVNKGVSVKYFSTVEELGHLVLDDWNEIVDMYLPPLMHDITLLDSIEYREWLAQQSFVSSCSEVFVSSPDVEETLLRLTKFAMSCTKAEVRGVGQDTFEAADWNCEDHSPWVEAKLRKDFVKNNTAKSILLLSGGRGVGKSTLAAHWLNEFRADNSHICVISHFVSASNRSMELVYIMQQSIRSLRKQFLLSDNYDSNSLCADIENKNDNNNDNFLSLCEAFVAAISLGPCVILFDGLNELNSNKKCDWLPGSLPKTCKIIFTTTSSDISYHCLSQRPDTTVINFPISMTGGSTVVTMISQHFPTLSQLIGGEKTLKRLAHLKIMQTALGSRITGSELVCYRVYSNLGIFMEESAEVWSLRDFWTLCVQNWVKEHSWTLTGQSSELNFADGGFDYTGWVADCLCLIAASRNGLAQDQVISVLKIIGYEGDLEVSNYDWLKFRLAAGATLRELGDGRLVFGHKYLQEIAEYLFFKSITSCSHDPETIIRSANLSRRRLYHKYLATYFSKQKLNVQVMEELPWHLMFSGETTSLVNYLTNCQVLMEMLPAASDLWLQDLTLYWHVCMKSSYLPDIVYLQLMLDLAVVDINDVQALEDKYNHAGLMTSAQRERVAASTPQLSESSYVQDVEHESADGWKSGCTPMEETEELGKIKVPGDLTSKDMMEGVFVTQTTSGSECQSRTSSSKQLKECSSEVASLGWYITGFLLQINQREASSILLSSLINYIKQNCLLTTELYLFLCRCHHLEGRFHEASSHLDKAEKSYRLALHAVMAAINLDDEMTHQDATQYLKGLLLSCYGNIFIHKKLLSGAEELLIEALDCVKDNSDVVVLKSTIYFYLGIIRSCQSDYQQAESCLRESAKLRSLWFGRCHPLAADALIALAKLLATPSNIRGQNVIQARSLYKQALAIQEKFLGASHLSVSDVLFEIGKLLAEENGRLAKQEALEYFRRCLDIRTTKLGGNNPLTISTRQRLTKLDVALQLKNYESGSSNRADNHPGRKPFSILTLHDSELSKLQNREKRKAVTHTDNQTSICSVSQYDAKNHVRPESILSTVVSLTSACERLLSGPVTEVPCLLWKKRDTLSSPGIKQQFVNTAKKDDLKDILDKTAGEDRAQDRIIVVNNEHFSDEMACRIPKNETDKSMNAVLSEYVGGGQGHPVIVDLQQNKTTISEIQQNQPLNAEIQKQPVIVDIQQKQPIISEIQQKQPIIAEIQHKQPIIAEIQQKQPINAEIQKQPITAEIQQKQPITAEIQQKQPIIAEIQLKQPIIAEIQQKQPIIAEIQQNLATNINIQHKEEIGNGLKEDNLDTQDLDSYADVMQDKAGKKKTLILHPLRVSQRMFQKFETGGDTDRPLSCQKCETGRATDRPLSCQKFETGGAIDRPLSWSSKSRNSAHSQRNVWSARSRTATMVSFTSSHLSHCNVPGRHDITLGNTQTITGPYNCLTSLLGDPPCPRQTSNKLHHMSAWYHVPGRFSTPQQPLPKKRMQRTKSARDIEALIAIKALNPKQHEQYQLTEQERSQINNRSKKNGHTHNNAHSFYSSSKPVLRPGYFLRYPKLIDNKISSKNLMVNGLEIPETRYYGNV